MRNKANVFSCTSTSELTSCGSLCRPACADATALSTTQIYCALQQNKVLAEISRGVGRSASILANSALGPSPMASKPSQDTAQPGNSLGPLRMIFRAAKRYPGLIIAASIALVVTAAATLAIPAGFRLLIDRGFAEGSDPAEIGRWFKYLFMIFAGLAIGTACRWVGAPVLPMKS